jgi:hypothetical protein
MVFVAIGDLTGLALRYDHRDTDGYYEALGRFPAELGRPVERVTDAARLEAEVLG